MIEQTNALFDSLKHLAPFVLRARVVSTGREKLLQHRNQLAFLMVTEDISENSRREILRDFPCPIYQALTAEQVETLFHFHNTKLLGFARNALSSQIQQLLKGRRLVAPSVEEVTMPENPKVVVLGASGIGRYHANWWERAGAQVVGFLGSSAESVERTEATLATLLGHPVKGYDNLERLLQHTSPDIVDVCLPPSLHFRASRVALLAGCHVLCEKPFLYDATLPSAVLHRQCDELIELANARTRLLGMCSQYFEVIRKCLDLSDLDNQPVTRLEATLLTPMRTHAPGALSSWLDLGAHLLAVVQGIALTRHLRPDTIRLAFPVPNQVTVNFECNDRSDNPNPPPPLECALTVGHLPTNTQSSNQRVFRLNESVFAAYNAQDDDGQFALELQNLVTAQSYRIPDPMRTLIDAFAHGRALLPGRIATQNLNWLMKIAQGIASKT